MQTSQAIAAAYMRLEQKRAGYANLLPSKACLRADSVDLEIFGKNAGASVGILVVLRPKLFEVCGERRLPLWVEPGECDLCRSKVGSKQLHDFC